ncbi:S8 family serine peptidase [Hyunsoonleella sp. SJ7]|uniref:S8 family serine peptidase n=1 Tax=Hyunsoonleella aquatilis TaxID=2762758 RepID=A0A923HBH0_9FLAO|nr:S8 family serine peptidase [Hyunsoonleella aquatilis]MBC3759439.1 S8 family serine peptidase [Hyunsoonleella aquatilis]
MKNFTFLILFYFTSFILNSQEEAWVYLMDKENVAMSIANPITILTQKAIDRKNRHGVSIDARDVPVNESYITQLKNATGITVMAKSKWFNAVHVRGSQTDIEALENLSFVDSVEFADRSLNTNKFSNEKNKSKLETQLTTFNYGNATNQIEMFNGDDLHLDNYTGTGMTIALLDAGYPNVNTMTSFQRLRDAGNFLGSYDFVGRDTDIYSGTTSNHGTLVFSDMAGYIENQFVGTAPDASYYLFITEDATSETPVEESYWVEAAERADSLGVDIINTSLGYSDFDGTKYDYSQADMNGATTFITRGANIAFEKGLLCVNSAGNSGAWGITAPADSPNVLTIGAVNASGTYASFSSVGTAYQPTQKPDIVAQGQASYVISENDIIFTANGTSFSSPILAGGVACLWQALPNKTNAEIMQLVRESASQFSSPDNFLGHGIPNLKSALDTALSVDENALTESSINIFPNPVADKLFIKFSADEGSLRLFDISGRYLRTHALISNRNTLDMSYLAKGIYLAEVQLETVSKTFKIIKQ